MRLQAAILGAVALLILCCGSGKSSPPRPVPAENRVLPALTFVPTATSRSPALRDYVEVLEEPSERGLVQFNGEAREGLLDVIVTGIEVVFDPAEPSLALNGYDGAQNVAALTIMADVLVLRGPLDLPGTDLTIFARRLVFEDADPGSPAAIHLSVLPTTWPKVSKAGQAGADGERSGNLALYIGELAVPDDAPEGTRRFVLKGGNGGPGGPAVPGQNPPPPSYLVTFSKADMKRHDRDLNARPGGKPGRGGDGGEIRSTRAEIEALAVCSGGEPGPETAGAAPGRIKYRVQGYRPPRRTGTAAGPVAGEPGTSPTFSLRSDAGAAPYAQPAVLGAIVRRLRDLYLAGEIDAAVTRAVSALEWAPEVDFEEPDLAREFRVRRSELLTIAERLGSGLDYFGNPPGWVPLLSLEANYATFEQETTAAVKMMYLSHWLELFWEKQDDRIASLEFAIGEKQGEIEDLRDRLAQVRKLIPVLAKEAGELREKTELMIARLKVRENEIAKKYAKDKEREEMVHALFEAMGATASGLSFFSPAMAPLSGALILTEAMIYSEPPNVSGGAASEVFRNMLAEEDIADARSRLAGLDPARDGSTKSFTAELDELSRDLSKATRAFVLQRIRDSLATQVSTEFDAELELNAILEGDAEFKRIFRDLISLVTKRQLFRDKLAEAEAIMDGTVHALREAAWAVDHLTASVRRNSARLDSTTRSVIRQMRERSKERLLLYQYYLAKSFEYRMLETCPIDPRQNRIYEAIEQMFGDGEDSDAPTPFGTESTRIDDLVAIYREDLSRIVNLTMKGLNSDRFEPVVATYEINLDARDLETLNSTGRVAVDIGAEGVVFEADRNCRLAAVEINEKGSRFVVVDPPTDDFSANLDLTIEPPEHSFITWGDQAYSFRYGRPRSTNLVLWGYSWRGPEDRGDPMRPSDSTRSLLARLVDPTYGDAGSLERIHFRPSAHGELVIRKGTASKPQGIDVRIEALSLTVEIEKNKSFRSR